MPKGRVFSDAALSGTWAPCLPLPTPLKKSGSVFRHRFLPSVRRGYRGGSIGLVESPRHGSPPRLFSDNSPLQRDWHLLARERNLQRRWIFLWHIGFFRFRWSSLGSSMTRVTSALTSRLTGQGDHRGPFFPWFLTSAPRCAFFAGALASFFASFAFLSLPYDLSFEREPVLQSLRLGCHSGRFLLGFDSCFFR
jgi:hypothetical protein